MRRKPPPPVGGRPSPALSLEDAKEQAVATLSEYFAQDHLQLDQFEQMVDAVQRAETSAEIRAALEVLPGARSSVPASPASQRPAPTSPEAALSATAAVRPSDQAVAVFGEAKREGAWTPAEDTKAIAVMGSVVLDLREARLATREISVFALSFFGSVEIVVPPGLDVECGVSAVFGGVEHKPPEPPQPPFGPERPCVRVRGISVFGSVEVHYRYPGESKREAKRRTRLEKRQRRRRGR